jgi:hypothetical protein
VSKQLKLLLERALSYLTKRRWPPVGLVEQIVAEAKRLKINPPVEYRYITSPEYQVEYWVRYPYGGLIRGTKCRLQRSPGQQSAPEVIPTVTYSPTEDVVRALQLWIPYLEAKDQASVAEQSPAASKPKTKRGKRDGESDTETKIVAASLSQNDIC